MSGHVGGLDSSLNLGALADVLVMDTTPAIQDRVRAALANAESLEAARQITSPTPSHANGRVSRKAQKAMDVQNLHRLWKEEGRESQELRRVLKLTSERLAAEREQSLQLEQRLKDVRLREASARMARKRAESEAAQASAEARAYKLHLEMANFENSKSQEAVNNLEMGRREAEAAAARARTTAQRLREKLVRERALHEGLSQGMHEGLRIGYDEGLGDGWADGHGEGFDEMRKRAFAVWEQALKTGAINPNAEFDLDKAILAERAKAGAITGRGPSRRTSVRESLNRYPSIGGHSRAKSNPTPYRAQITSSDDLTSPITSPRRVPVPQFAPERAPVISEIPITQSHPILVTVTSPPDSNLPQSVRSPSPRLVPFSNISTTSLGQHGPVEPMYEGMVPTVDENGHINLPPPHDINPSPSTRSVPLPPAGEPPSGTRTPRTPRSRRPSLSATQGHDMHDEADRERLSSRPPSRQTARPEDLAAQEAQRAREAQLEAKRAELEGQMRALEEERRRFATQLEQERAMHVADMKMREEQEEARERQRKLEKEAELAREAEREHERIKELERGKLKEQELELQRARAAEQVAKTQRLQAEIERARIELEAAERQREIEREAERKAALEREMERKAAEDAATRQREIEREAAERLASERIKQEREAAERLAQERAMHERISAEMEANRKVDAARAEAEQIAARERLQAEQVAALTQRLEQQQQQERDLPAPPLSVRNGPSGDDSDYDDDDPTTDDAVPYDASGQRQHPGRRKNGRGSVYSAKTARTGMSTPLSQFTLLEETEAPGGNKGKTSAQRKQAMAWHRDATLARERAARMPVIPETASHTNGEAEKLVPRTPHSSLPALPVKLDKAYPPPMGPASPRTATNRDIPPIIPTEHGIIPNELGQSMNPWSAGNDFSSTDQVEKIIPRDKPNRTVVPVPAPNAPIYMGGTPMNQSRGTHRNPYTQSIEQYDEMRSPSPTPSHRVGKPVSPIPTILVERPSDEGIQTTARAGQGKGMNAASGGSLPRSILKNTVKSSKKKNNSHNSRDQSTSSPSNRASQPVIPNLPNLASGPAITPAQPPTRPQPLGSIRMAPKSPYYVAATAVAVDEAAKDAPPPPAPPQPAKPTDSPASSGIVPVMGHDLPEYKGRAPMARPGYTIPPQKTDIELFGAPERPRGWNIGPPSQTFDDTPGPRSHGPTNTSRSPTVIPVAPVMPDNPHVSPVALNQSVESGAFGPAPGSSGPAYLPSQTPRKFARPIGSQPVNFDPPPPSAKTPKTPYHTMTPRMQRPVGAPTAGPEDIPPVITPVAPPFNPITPKMQRPAGAPTGSPEFGALPPEDLPAFPSAQTKPPMRRPGMQNWDSVPKVDTFQMMEGPASHSHHFSTPGPAHRALPGNRPIVERIAHTPQPVIPAFEKSAQQPGQGWRTGPMPAVALPSSSPGQTQAMLESAADIWGRKPTFQKPATPRVNPPSPPPIIPDVPQPPPAPPAPAETPIVAEDGGAADEAGFAPSGNKKPSKKQKAKAKKAAATGKGKPTLGGPQPVSSIVRAASAEENPSPNSKPVGIPSLTITAPSPSVSPAPPNDHTDAPLVRPFGNGSNAPARNVTHIAGPFVAPPSPARTNKSQKPTIEEVTDEDGRQPSNGRKLPPGKKKKAWDAWDD